MWPLDKTLGFVLQVESELNLLEEVCTQIFGGHMKDFGSLQCVPPIHSLFSGHKAAQL